MRAPLLLAAVCAAVLARPVLADETAGICEEAERRYAKIAADQPVPPGTVVVKTFKYTFCPKEVTVRPGTTVRWVNVERTTHNAWLRDLGQPEPDRLFLGESWEFTFASPGEYPYLCGPHWEQEGMVGKVVVGE